ncbi:MAG: sigma-70 family RNA polymerase sigma factor [Actinobacteria bacterium]|nr:sigma-70 family RNA polymerase sigma factor [Actinomycetota bacterium]
MTQDPQNEFLRELMLKARQGDKRAYGKIFKLCYPDIYDYIARRVGNRSDAEDLTMQVFARGLKAVGGYEERGYSVKAWLYRIAHNAVVDHFRKLKKPVDLDSVGEVADGKDIEHEVASRDELDRLQIEIGKLPGAQAEVIILRFMEDRSITETAMILDKKEVTVRALQFKGIKNLRKRFSEGESAPGDNVVDDDNWNRTGFK